MTIKELFEGKTGDFPHRHELFQEGAEGRHNRAGQAHLAFWRASFHKARYPPTQATASRPPMGAASEVRLPPLAVPDRPVRFRPAARCSTDHSAYLAGDRGGATVGMI